MISSTPTKTLGRARDGCWTCRRRKKKCDSTTWPCSACRRLGLPCERGVRLVWEDDERREGIARRGPQRIHQPEPGEPSRGTSVPFADLPEQHSAPDRDKWLPAQLSFARATGDATKATRAHAGHGHSASSVTAKSSRIEPAFAADSTPDIMEHVDEPNAAFNGALSMVPGISTSLSLYPRQLESTELDLLGNYIQRFSRSYPTFAEPTNPFLSVLLPLAMQESIVMDTLLVLSSAQTGRPVSFGVESEFLRLRQRALRGSRKLLVGDKEASSPGGQTPKVVTLRQLENLSEKTLLMMLASAMMFLLHDKISGETTWKPHMDFIGRLCASFSERFPSSPETAEAFQFLYNLFLYNDLIRATSLMTSTSTPFYVTAGSIAPSQMLQDDSRYYFPSLIAKISNGDLTVTETDIMAWDGNMYWLPSFALSPSSSNDRELLTEEQKTMVKLYQVAAVMYLHMREGLALEIGMLGLNDAAGLGAMASYAVGLVACIPRGSSLENALLWPIGIIARPLNRFQISERATILERLQQLQFRFGMRHFERFREVLVRNWATHDTGSEVFTTQDTTMLLLG